MPPTSRRRLTHWLLWATGTGALAVPLAHGLFAGGAERRLFLPGETTDGHYQIELQCAACHASSFTSRDEMQASCERCHGEELRRAKDSHPKAKFTDPRNAARTARLDARYCVTCHREHVEGATLPAGLTLPEDYCVECHSDVATERPSHAGLPFEGCSAAGCHNFHDNRALYEDFLARRAEQPALLAEPVVHSQREPARRSKPLAMNDADAPSTVTLDASELAAWARSAHGRAGINCSSCHGGQVAGFEAGASQARCQQCHEPQLRTFQEGKHGLRTGQGLSPMSPDQARAAMHTTAHDRLLGCNACHGAHDFDARGSAVDACLGCHADQHSQAYATSRHAALYRAELLGSAPPGSGVSCATCHMPRQETEAGGSHTVHNQNDNLRPSEKMLRGVCNDCHGLGFSIDALADQQLVLRNFNGKPAAHVASLDMAKRRAAH